MPTIIPARLDDLVLACVATARRPPSPPEVVRATRRLAPSTLDDAAWTEVVSEARARLRDARDLDEGGAATGDLATIARRFGASGPLTWSQLTGKLVPALALELAAGDARAQARLVDRDSWAAAIVGRAQGIWRQGPPPSLAAVCDALVWRGLGLTGTARRTPPEIRALFVGKLLGAAAGPPDRQVRLLAARETGAVRADLRALREALCRRWLCGQRWTRAEGSSLEGLAGAVRDAAARTRDGVFGDRKVFIASVWRALRGHAEVAGWSLDDFKGQLVAAHQAGLVALARADLTAAMDPAEVAGSEIAHLEARYHFVLREDRP